MNSPTSAIIFIYLFFQEQEDVTKRHAEEIRALHQKLDVYMDTSLDRFKQTTLVLLLMKQENSRGQVCLFPKQLTIEQTIPLTFSRS